MSELKDAIAYVIHAPIDGKITVLLFVFVCIVALVFEQLWLHERNRNQSRLRLENKDNAQIATPRAANTFIKVIRAVKPVLLGSPAWTAFKKASSILLSTQKDATPTIAKRNHLTPIECNTGNHDNQSQLTKKGE